MKLKNPTGTKTIILKKEENQQIFLEDFATHSSDFKLEIILKGDRAEVEIIGKMQSEDMVSKKLAVRVVFQGFGQKAFLNLKGIAQDRSRLEFDGSVVLEKSSEDGEVRIVEHIVLFDQAKGKCLPVLTVKTDKVKKASHSASIAPFDKDQILFCQARGISQKDTENLLKKGFFNHK